MLKTEYITKTSMPPLLYLYINLIQIKLMPTMQIVNVISSVV